MDQEGIPECYFTDANGIAAVHPETKYTKLLSMSHGCLPFFLMQQEVEFFCKDIPDSSDH